MLSIWLIINIFTASVFSVFTLINIYQNFRGGSHKYVLIGAFGHVKYLLFELGLVCFCFVAFFDKKT